MSDIETQQSTTYDESDIQILDGLEAIRKRPGMYVGGTGVQGFHHLFKEVLDNAVDEALAGFCTQIDITVHQDQSLSVFDNGRGIPIGMHESGRRAIEVLATVPHSGGKFGGKGYNASGGLHGVGLTAVNALSKWMKITVQRDNTLYEQTFSSDDTNIGMPGEPTIQDAKSRRTGTLVRFLPDPKVFGNLKFQFGMLEEKARVAAFLNSGIKVTLTDLREGQKNKLVFCYEGGISEFVRYLNEEKGTIHDPIYLSSNENGVFVEMAFQYTDAYSEATASFVNCIPTKSGGTHVRGFRTGFTKVCNDFARKNGLLKEKESNLEGDQLREGMTCILSVRIEEPEFIGQTKDELANKELTTLVSAIVTDQFGSYLDQNRDFAEMIIKRAIVARQAKEAAKQAAEEVRLGKHKRDKNGRKKILVEKLTPPQSKDYANNELYLVEGDSAGGSAKQGRDFRFQGVLPLKGKGINVEKTKLKDILENQEILSIVEAIGAGIGPTFDLSRCKYGKVVIMSDADPDGGHIQTLLATLFYRYMRPLIDAGMLYVAHPPLFKITIRGKRGAGKNEEVMYAWNDDELNEIRKNLSRSKTSFEVQRYKGLGEMNPEQLWETTMNPEVRTLIRVDINDPTTVEKRVNTLMGNKADIRRQWLYENVDFSKFEE